MRKFQQKRCLNCAYFYTPTGSSSKFCSIDCRNEFYRPRIRIRNRKIRLAQGKLVGVGKGGAPHFGKRNPMWKNGISIFLRMRPIIKTRRRFCEHCGKDLEDATHYQWVVHHKDRNRLNNKMSNLQLLCKSCHQIEHRCWKAFEGATTIPKGSTNQEVGKRMAS